MRFFEMFNRELRPDQLVQWAPMIFAQKGMLNWDENLVSQFADFCFENGDEALSSLLRNDQERNLQKDMDNVINRSWSGYRVSRGRLSSIPVYARDGKNSYGLVIDGNLGAVARGGPDGQTLYIKQPYDRRFHIESATYPIPPEAIAAHVCHKIAFGWV